MRTVGQMDSKEVSQGIRREIRPYLKEIGFSRFTSRTAWRYADRRIDVVNFQSFNAYHASVMGCTTFSFAVNLGCYLTDIPPPFDKDRMKRRNGQLCPDEASCQFRTHLKKTFYQPEYGLNDVWLVDPAGTYLEEVLLDVRRVIEETARPWFDRLSRPSEVLRILIEEEEGNELWGFGAKRSPARNYLVGYYARSRGLFEIAHQRLYKALSSGCYDRIAETLERDAYCAAQQASAPNPIPRP